MLSQLGEHFSPASCLLAGGMCQRGNLTCPGPAKPRKVQKVSRPLGSWAKGGNRQLQEGGTRPSELQAAVTFQLWVLSLRRGWFRRGEAKGMTWGEVSLKTEP